MYLIDTDGLNRLGRAPDGHEPHWPEAVAAIRLLVSLTGCRRSEALNMRWHDIGNGKLDLADSKTGPHAVPLGEAARTPIAAPSGERAPDALLFPGYAHGNPSMDHTI